MQMRVWECCKVKGDYFTLAYRLRNVPDSQQRTKPFKDSGNAWLAFHIRTPVEGGYKDSWLLIEVQFLSCITYMLSVMDMVPI